MSSSSVRSSFGSASASASASSSSSSLLCTGVVSPEERRETVEEGSDQCLRLPPGVA